MEQPILAQEVDIEGDAIVILWNDGHRGIYPSPLPAAPLPVRQLCR